MGFQENFINFFWEYVGTLMFDSFMEAKVKKELSVSQRQAIIKLLEKWIRIEDLLKTGVLYHF